LAQFLPGDAESVLANLPTGSVRCCLTSPPYWNLRDYQTAEWVGGNANGGGCLHKMKTRHQVQGTTSARSGRRNVEEQRNDNFRHTCGDCGAVRVDRQIGLEDSPEEYVERLVRVFREVRRVLTTDATLWLNLGDSYANPGHYKGNPGDVGSIGRPRISDNGDVPQREKKGPGLKNKDLVGIPWMTALALRQDGWYLRSEIVWEKPNCTPSSATDRPTRSHETVFLLSKRARYYYDGEAIAEPLQSGESDRRKMR